MLRLIKYFHHFNNNRAYIQCLLAVGQHSNTKKTSLEHSAVSGRREAPGLRSRRHCHHRCALLRYMPPGRHQQQSIKNQSSLPQRKSSQHPPHISPGIQCLQFIQTVRIQGSAILRGNHNSLSLAPPPQSSLSWDRPLMTSFLLRVKSAPRPLLGSFLRASR